MATSQPRKNYWRQGIAQRKAARPAKSGDCNVATVHGRAMRGEPLTGDTSKSEALEDQWYFLQCHALAGKNVEFSQLGDDGPLAYGPEQIGLSCERRYYPETAFGVVAKSFGEVHFTVLSPRRERT
jgi:hypothetical protein